jgi:catechol 2,3-dioxygenase-like lactoylglutathione lyase family enzyme
MELGAFSVSLSVADLDASRAFYETLGFGQVGGNADEGWLIMRNGFAVIGLFRGMFEGNILTFNPGLDVNTRPLDTFTDVRDLQEALQDAGIELTETTDPDGEGPAYVSLRDPDGNAILIDQFAPRPEA